MNSKNRRNRIDFLFFLFYLSHKRWIQSITKTSKSSEFFYDYLYREKQKNSELLDVLVITINTLFFDLVECIFVIFKCRKINFFMKDKICGVYLITNNLNGMMYSGQSVNCIQRWRKHICNSEKKSFIDKVIKEFGKENFTFKIEKECLPEELDFYERETIEKYNTLYPNGYNLYTGGKKNFITSEESKEKNRIAHIGITAWNKDLKMSPEFCEKLRISQKGKHKANSGSFKKGQTPWNKDKVTPEEVRRKLSEALKNKPKSRWLTPSGEIKYMDKSNAGRHHPDWVLIEEDL